MELFEINPFIRFFKTIPRPRSNTRSDAESVRTYDCRLFYILSGECRFQIHERLYSLSENGILYIPSGTPYRLSYESISPLTALIVNFDFDQAHRTRESVMKPEFLQSFDETKWIRVPNVLAFSEPISIANAQRLRQRLIDAEKEIASSNHHCKEVASSILRLVLLDMLRIKNCEHNTEETLSQRIKNYLNRHYAEEITAEILGQRFGYHPYHLNRVFKKHVGTTVRQYLIDQRIRAAKSMLHSTELTVEEISSAVGISGQAYFSYCFKKCVGISPSEYRAKKGIYYL